MIAALLVLATAGACSSDGGTGVSSPFAGVYILETVNGGALPFIESEIDSLGTHSFALDSSSITLRKEGTFTERLAVRFIEPTFVDGAKADFIGSFTVTGSTLRMIATSVLLDGSPVPGFGPDTVNAVLANNVITTSVADTVNGTIFPYVSVYRKQ